MATFTRMARIYEKHESKFLNSALILYLCFGAFLFNYLGEFRVEDSNNVKVSSTTVNTATIQTNDYIKNETTVSSDLYSKHNTKVGGKSKQTKDLNELRLASVRRMWNITNRLNILYESNWTLLVLDELVEFERSLLESLSSEQKELSNDSGDKDEDEGVNVEVEIEIEKDESEKEKEKSEKEKESSSGKKAADKKAGSLTTTATTTNSDTKSNRSIKKSFLHSLATITTIASPHGTPKTSTGKLATILYGTLGIPILLFTITKTGNHLAHSTLNTILIVRHYCFSIPIHYLCCSCNFYLCFRLLSWCCCCCCCSYICCLTSDKDKAKCCDSRNAPKLKLRHHHTRRRRKRSSSSSYNQAHDASGAIYLQGDSKQVVENLNNLQLTTEQIKLSNYSQQKSVRFSNQGGKQNFEFNSSQDNVRDLNDQNDEIDQSIGDEENLYSSGVFLASLIIVGIYLSAGAYVYSRDNNLTLVDGLFEVYALLSTSKMPEALNSKGAQKEDIMTVYQSLKSNSLIKTPSSGGKLSDTFKKSGKRNVDPLGVEAFVWETLYLICGLHLLSMCGHFARLWLSGKIGQELSNCQLKDLSNTTCNGHIPSIMGTLTDTNNSGNGNGNGGGGGVGSSSFGDFGQITGNIEQKSSDHYLMQASLPTTYVSSSNQQMEPHLSINQQVSDISSIQQQQQQQPQEVNLAELFVVTSQTASPADLQYTTTRQQQQQQASSQQQTSDVSFASTDKSTDRGSLCLHHQAQMPNVAHTQTGTFYNPPGSTYTSQPSQASYIGLPSHNHHHHHHHHGGQNESSSHLYPTLLANNVNQSLVDEGECDDDDDEMDQMLKSCLNGSSNLPTSSSLVHLSSNTQKADNCIHQHYKHQANPSNLSYNKVNGFSRSNHSEQHNNNNSNSNRLGSLTRDSSRLRFGLDNNNGCEQDSSLNTTADANTLSSSSGRTVKIIRNLEQSYPNGIKFCVDESTSKRQ